MDFYVHNLAQMGAANAAVASENIYNQQGALVVPAGQSIHLNVIEKIAAHKLSRPIEESVTLKCCVSSGDIISQFKAMPNHPEVSELLRRQALLDRFESKCRGVDRYPLINQKLTVMAERFPRLYKKAVFGAFVSMLLCDELNLNEEQSHNIFIAALARDIGLLHIDPKTVKKRGPLTAKEWRLMQGHVAIGYHFLSLVPNIPRATQIAVLEHHERADGFGYPREKLDNQLSMEGQIVAFADQTIALFNKYVVRMGYSMLALEPILQVNASRHRMENASAAIRFFRRIAGPMKPRAKRDNLDKSIDMLSKAHPLFHLLFSQMKAFNDLLNKTGFAAITKRSGCAIKALEELMITSGIDNQFLLKWVLELKQKGLETKEVLELERYELMIFEGGWRFTELIKHFELALNSESHSNLITPDHQAEFKRLYQTFDLLTSTTEQC